MVPVVVFELFLRFVFIRARIHGFAGSRSGTVLLITESFHLISGILSMLKQFYWLESYV